MATDKEQRTIEIILKAQEANASIKDMGAGAAVMTAQLRKMGQDDPGRAKLVADLQQLNQRLGVSNKEMRAVVLSEEQLRAAAEKLNQENIQVVVNGKKVAASFNEIEAAAKVLEKELKELPAGTEAFLKKSKELEAVKDRMEEVNEEMAGSQKNAVMAALGLDGITSASGLMRAGFQAAMSALLPLLAIQQIWEWVQAFAGVVEEVDKVRAAVNTATGAQGEMLDTLTARTRALSMSFGVEYADALKGVDVLAKQMGISHVEAFDLMEKGYVAGANRSEELLDNIKEYAVQFKAAGYSAEEMMAYLTNAELGGVFSDKGADVVKEFGIRIKEQTVATRDAMDAAFGQQFTDRIFKGLNEGSMTVKQALGEVSQAMNDTRVPASKLQTVVADVFGGPGEDAGTAYLQSLYKVGEGMDALIDKTNEYTRLQLELLESNKWLAEEQEKLAVNFAGTGSSLTNLWTTFKARLYADLNGIVAGLQELGWVGEASVAALKSWGSSFVEVFSRIAHADWKGAKTALRQMGQESADAYTTAYYAAMERAERARAAAVAARKKEAAPAAPDDVKMGDSSRQDDEKAQKEKDAKAKAKAKKDAEELKKSREDAAKAALAAERSIEDLRVALIKDKYDREIADINLQTERKMAAIKGSEEQQYEQWLLLEQERQAKVAAVEAQRAEDKAKLDEETAAKKAELKAADDELFLAGLAQRVELGLATEQEYQDKLYQLQQEGLAQRLQQLVDAGLGETAEAKKIQAELLNGQANYVARHKKQGTDLKNFELAIAGEKVGMLTDTLGFLVDNLDKQGKAFMLFKQALKAAQIAQIFVNLEGELSNNRVNATNPLNPLNLLPGGQALVAAELAVKNTIAYTQAGLGAIRVAAFAKGGRTDQLANLVPPAMLAGLVGGASGGSFAGGGVVPGPQLGLIGEAGAELVIPNWLFTDPKQANLMGYLEAQIASRGNAFADGGRRAERGSGVVVGPDAGDALSNGAVVELLQQLVRGHQEFREEITDWQRNLAAPIDLHKVKRGLNDIERVQSGGLR